MKKLKKVFAVLLTLAMVMGLSMTAFAAETDGKVAAKGTAEDKGTITVSGIDDANAGVVVKAYPIVTAKYDASKGNFTGYDNAWGIKDIKNPTESELANIAAGKTADGKTNKALPEGKTLTKQADGTYKNGADVELGVGMYLILVSGAETNVYNPAVASINYVNENGNMIVDSTGTLTMATVASGATWVKKSTQPEVDKNVKNESTGEETSSKQNTANIGDTLIYTVEVKNIPDYRGNYPKLQVTDTLSAGLTYANTDEDPLTVKIGDKVLAVGTDYTLTVSGQVITVNFVVNGKYTLNSYAGQSAVIEYKAAVNSSAKLNELGNNNDAVLTYSRNSSIDNNDGTDESKTYTYTFDIDGVLTGGDKENTIDTTHIINKLGETVETIIVEGVEKEVKKPLPGAKFGLYTDEDAKTPYKNSATGFDGSSIESDDGGQLHMSGLAAGTYYLKEISAPEGYSVNSQIFKIEITASYYTEGEYINRLKEWGVKVNDTEVAKFGVSFSVENEAEKITVKRTDTIKKEEDSEHEGFNIRNTQLSSLPSTGGIGTTIFTIGGCAIMVIAAALFFASRRKSAK